MRAAVVEEGSVVVREVPTPRPEAGEVLVRVALCGICGSDVRLLAEGFFPPGTVIGHEISGTVAEVGPGVEGWRIGERVTVLPAVTCGDCRYCRSDTWLHCPQARFLGIHRDLPGGFAEYVKVPAGTLHRLPDEVSDEAGALVEPCAVALRAVRRSGLKLGESVAVLGAGPIGLFALELAQAAGADPIYVVEPGPDLSLIHI